MQGVRPTVKRGRKNYFIYLGDSTGSWETRQKTLKSLSGLKHLPRGVARQAGSLAFSEASCELKIPKSKAKSRVWQTIPSGRDSAFGTILT